MLSTFFSYQIQNTAATWRENYSSRNQHRVPRPWEQHLWSQWWGWQQCRYQHQQWGVSRALSPRVCWAARKQGPACPAFPEPSRTRAGFYLGRLGMGNLADSPVSLLQREEEGTTTKKPKPLLLTLKTILFVITLCDFLPCGCMRAYMTK